MPLIDLQTFKTKKCDQTHNPPQLTVHYFSCTMYHSRDDKRRNPFTPNKRQLIYCDYYVEDYYSTQMSSNLVEYLYHPNVYKTISCQHRSNHHYQNNPEQAKYCPHKYCPYLHQDEDIKSLQHYRNLPAKTTFDLVKMEIPTAQQFLHLLNNKIDKVDAAYQIQIDNAKKHFRTISEHSKAHSKDKQQIKSNTSVKDVIPAPAIISPNLQKPKQQNPNWYANYTYFQLGERLPIIEDRHHQFKNFRDIIQNDISKTMMKYITAFLNSQGGALYVGIDDSSYVCGLEIKQHEYDKFLLAIDREGKFNMSPPLMPQKYSIRRIPVIHHHKKNRELWVIEIKVTASQNDKKTRMLTTYNRQCFVRMNASTHKLDAVDLMQYIRVYEQDKNDKRDKAQIIQQVQKFIDRKGPNLSLQSLKDLRDTTVKLKDRLDSLLDQKIKLQDKS